MREIEKTFKELKGRGDGALIAYITGGDPSVEYSLKFAQALSSAGVDILELGIPFSDPIADGPTIQSAMVRALRAGTTPLQVLELARDIKNDCGIPVVLLTYYNIIYRMGIEKFLRKSRDCKVDGFIIPDLPIEEAGEFKQIAEKLELDTIFLATPATPISRVRKILDYTSGFLYLVSIFGITGAREKLQELTITTVRALKPVVALRTNLAVGFGISKPEHVRTIISEGAEGAIVGSAFVRLIGKYKNRIDQAVKRLENLARELKRAAVGSLSPI